MPIVPQVPEKTLSAERIMFRAPVTIEQIEQTNAWLERKMDAKLASARRLHRMSLQRGERRILTVAV